MDLKAIRLKHDPDVGVWVDLDFLGDDFAGGKVKVRPLWNSDYSWLYAKMAADVPKERKLADGRLHPAEESRIVSECLIQTVLYDWAGFTDDGEPMPYSEDLKADLLRDPLGLPFKGAVISAAGRIQAHGRASLEDDLKN